MADNVIESFLVAVGWKTDRASAQTADAALNRTKLRADALQKEIGQLGARMKTLGEQFVNFAGTPTDKTLASADRIRRTHLRLAGEIKGLGLAAAATTTTFVTGFTEIARKYSDLYYVAQRTGTTAANLSSLRFGGEQIGVGADQMTAIVNNMAAAIRMSPGLGGVLRGLSGDFTALATGTGSARDRTREFLGFVDQMAKQAPYYRDRLGQMFGISPDVMEQLVANRAVLRQTFDQYQRDLRRAGINEDAFYKHTAQITRDWGQLWAHAELILQQSFEEAYPTVEKALKGIDSLISNHVLPYNAKHPGAATAETAAISYAGGMTGLALLGKVPGLGVAGKVAGALGRLGPYGALLTLHGDTDPEATRWTMQHQAPGPGFFGQGGTLEKWIGGHVSAGASAIAGALSGPFSAGSTAAENVMARGLPTFEHGGIVANLHPGEMVLPKAISDGLQTLLGMGRRAGSRVADYLMEWLRGSGGFRPFVQLDPSSLREMLGGTGGSGMGTAVGGGISVGGIGAEAPLQGRKEVFHTEGRHFGSMTVGGGLDKVFRAAAGNVEAYIRGVIAKAGGNRMAQAGLLSNFFGESRLDPTAVNPKSGATGIAQWLGPRLRELRALGDPAKIETQGKLLFRELTGAYHGVLERMNAAVTPAQSAAIGLVGFEGVNRRNSMIAGAPWNKMLATHTEFADRFYNQIADARLGADVHHHHYGDRHVTAHQTNHIHLGSGGAVPAAVNRALAGSHDRLAATLVRNSRPILD